MHVTVAKPRDHIGPGGVEAMQVINREVFRWVFMALFLGMAAVSLVLIGLGYSRLGTAGGLPILLAWPVGGAIAAGAAWLIGKTALGLRSDYLAIATLGIAEIVIAVLKNED